MLQRPSCARNGRMGQSVANACTRSRRRALRSPSSRAAFIGAPRRGCRGARGRRSEAAASMRESACAAGGRSKPEKVRGTPARSVSKADSNLTGGSGQGAAQAAPDLLRAGIVQRACIHVPRCHEYFEQRVEMTTGPSGSWSAWMVLSLLLIFFVAAFIATKMNALLPA